MSEQRDLAVRLAQLDRLMHPTPWEFFRDSFDHKVNTPGRLKAAIKVPYAYDPKGAKMAGSQTQAAAEAEFITLCRNNAELISRALRAYDGPMP